MGLTIAKSLAEAMDGSITVSSTKGSGSTFTLLLNLPVDKNLRSELPIKPKIFEFKEGVRILLVDDNEMNRMMACAVLHRKKFMVMEAVNGVDAVSKVREYEFDLVLMDLMMPEMDGFEATKIIRTELNSTVPIVALTANAIVGDDHKCLESGMQDYLSKPFAPDELYEAIFNNLAS